jgi:hypothetical protein
MTRGNLRDVYGNRRKDRIVFTASRNNLRIPAPVATASCELMTSLSRYRIHWMSAASLVLGMAMLAMSAPSFADDATPPICTDRPTKANATCTVPAGSFQVETDIGNTTHDHQASTTTRTINTITPTLKYGIDESTDIQLSWSPRIRIDARDHAGDARSRTAGHGDTYLRVKHRLVETDSVSVSIIPFVKAPTATHGVGNDRWEGGIALPVGLPLAGGFSLTFGPEIDLLADADGSGHHAALVNLVNVSHPLGSRTTLAVEVWDLVNRDPLGTVRQRSADMAISYLIGPTWQVDVGANIGLTRETPDRQVYVGLSARF